MDIMRYVMRHIWNLAFVNASITMLYVVNFQCPIICTGIVQGPKTMIIWICITSNGEQINVAVTHPWYFGNFLCFRGTRWKEKEIRLGKNILWLNDLMKMKADGRKCGCWWRGGIVQMALIEHWGGEKFCCLSVGAYVCGDECRVTKVIFNLHGQNQMMKTWEYHQQHHRQLFHRMLINHFLLSVHVYVSMFNVCHVAELLESFTFVQIGAYWLDIHDIIGQGSIVTNNSVREHSEGLDHKWRNIIDWWAISRTRASIHSAKSMTYSHDGLHEAHQQSIWTQI